MAAPDEAKTHPKPTPAPVAKRAPADDHEDDDAKGTGHAPKPKFLPTGLSRAIVVASVLIALTVLVSSFYGGRYELVPAPNSMNGFMYRIDKLTGKVHFCAPAQCTEIPVQKTAGGE